MLLIGIAKSLDTEENNNKVHGMVQWNLSGGIVIASTCLTVSNEVWNLIIISTVSKNNMS